MRPTSKIILILSAIVALDLVMGFDARFTIINITWCIPIAYDWYKEAKEDDKIK